MYEFPNEEGLLTPEEALHKVREMNLHPMRIRKLEDARHIFSHVEWQMHRYMIQVDSLTREESGMLFVEIKEAEKKYAIPAAFGAYTKYLDSRIGNEKYEETVCKKGPKETGYHRNG
ncbi:MAG: NUDIX domain-containing protein [Eubacterium ramulus]